MRLISKLSIGLILVCLMCQLGLASSGISFSSSSVEEGVLVVNINADKNEEVNIDIRDHSGVIVYSEQLKGGQNLTRKYDLNNLSYGEYRIQIDLENKIEIQRITKSKTGIEYSPASDVTVYKPVINLDDNMVDLNFLCFHGNFDIEIIDESGHAVYQANQNAYGVFKSRYDVSQLNTGNYLFFVTLTNEDYSGSFTKSISIDK